MPTWALALGQIVSYLAGLPVFAVTAWTALTLVHRSGIKWDMTSGLLFASIFGWSVGIVPAIIDGVIAVNQVMHNTMWVPGALPHVPDSRVWWRCSSGSCTT